MEMEDKKLKRFLQDEMNREADLIMKEVDSDPSLKDVVAPEEIYDNLMQQIHDYEAEQASKNSQASEEEQELIRLGKLYKKKRSRRKYYVLLLAGVCVLAYGITSIGGGKKVFTEMKRMLGDKAQTVVNTQDGEGKVVERDTLNEEEAYEQINEKFGFYPAKMHYVPEGMGFVEAVIEEELQSARLYYADSEEKTIQIRVLTQNRTGSIGSDIEDILMNEYEKEVNGKNITIKQYKVEDGQLTRWSVSFEHNGIQYSMLLMEIDEQEMNKVIENLYFS
jgi:hypothetical protein